MMAIDADDGRPLNLRREHTEHNVDVTLGDGSRHVFDLESAEQRESLATHVAKGAVTTMRTREFNFHDAFLKLTGTAFE